MLAEVSGGLGGVERSVVGELVQLLTDEWLDVNVRRAIAIALGRLGEPEEVAEAVLYLATAAFCNGTILNISGGNVRAVIC